MLYGREGLPRLTFVQEFSIEIPDKEADAILSSMFPRQNATIVLILLQSTKQ